MSYEQIEQMRVEMHTEEMRRDLESAVNTVPWERDDLARYLIEQGWRKADDVRTNPLGATVPAEMPPLWWSPTDGLYTQNAPADWDAVVWHRAKNLPLPADAQRLGPVSDES
ncbi:hypothetical protein [Amycolatopsis thermoflava]|uniref:hypothetical protein n=1 Tax=Amycolatopsis thermoflava TaxID=84480 RepID=UPI0003F5F8BE|nr:hypothetical protein [Amycolatopsis thermoflava]